MYKEDSVLWL